MEVAQQFFQGLNGPASMTFLGLLTAAFLLGLLPAGLIYAFRIRDLERKTQKHVFAHQAILQEKNVMAGRIERETAKGLTHLNELRILRSEKSQLQTDLLKAEQALRAARADALALRSQHEDRENQIRGLKNKASGLQAQVQALKAAAKPQLQNPAFDLNAMASLTTAKAKVQALEKRVELLTADNEKLRRELTTNA